MNGRVFLYIVAITVAFAVSGNAQLGLDSTGGPSLKGEQLVPAALGVRTDKLGNSWNIEQNGTLGRVGNSMINSGLTLLLNNQQFYTYQPMMTADGKEFVLRNRQSSATAGLQIVRRIRMHEREGVVRYLEILSNTTPNPLTLNVSLRTNFSGNYKTYLTNEGNSSVVMLGNRETGVLVTPGSSQSNRAFLFSLNSEKSALKPTISSQNKYGLTFQYNLTIPAGQTTVLAHAVSQLPVPRSFERKSLQRIFRPVSLDRLVSQFPRELRKLVANVGGSNAPGGAAVLASTSVEALGVNRGRRDVLALGDQTRLIGTASCAKLTLKTAYGESEIPFEDVQAIVGGNRGRRDVARVFLRDGQVFTGEATGEGLRFVMASGGKMNLDIRSLDRLVRAKANRDGRWGERVSALLETWSGDRLAIETGDDVRLVGVTPWGSLEFSLGDLLWLAPIEDEPVGHYAELKDGTRCFVFLAGEQLAVQSSAFGTYDIEVPQVRAIVTAAGIRRQAEMDSGEPVMPVVEGDASTSRLPTIMAAGDQKVVGAIVNETFDVLTNAETIQIRPIEVRELTNLSVDERAPVSSDGPVFRVELWGGGVMTGHLAENFITMRVRDSEWQMPVADLRYLRTPVPNLPENSRQEIAGLIRQLGADEWQVRENATEELGGYGYLARSVLEDELRINRDPEIRRRLEAILGRME